MTASDEQPVDVLEVTVRQVATPPAPPPPPALGSLLSSPPPATRARRRWKRPRMPGVVPRIVLVAVAAVIVALAIDAFVGGVVYRQRQNQLAADFRTPRPYTSVGRSLAVIQIPRLGVNDVVAEGVTASTLRGGPGHVPRSATPGSTGNAVVYGHRNHFGGAFASLAKLKEGDEIYVQPKGTSEILLYTVTKIDIGGDELLEKLAPTDDVRLTLVTSAGGRFGSKRLVVQAVADAPVERPPSASKPPAALERFEPDDGLVSGNLVLAGGWIAIGLLAYFGLRSRYARSIVIVVSAAPMLAGLVMLWFEIDRWLPATL